jgi:BlaR1 peptidase M56
MTYLLKAHICLSIFLMIYWVFLRKNTFYQLNRIYFLLAIIGSIALPLLDVSDFVNQHHEISRGEVVTYIPDLSFRADNQLVIEQKLPLNSISNSKIYFNFFDIFQAIFLSGIVVLLCKLIVQIISIFRFLNISIPQIINKIKVRNLSSDVSPFSFFNYIFININKHSEEDLSEIIAHEYAHARQLHSVDVMLVELFCVLFWINPLAWILRKFLKQNLEFLTDESVLNDGFEVRHYQYNLLKISGLIPIAVTNNFNFSDLKLRIKMMNRKRSSKLHLLKYILTIPLGAALILAFNISKAKPFNVHKSVMENVKEMVKLVEFKPESLPLLQGKISNNKSVLNLENYQIKSKGIIEDESVLLKKIPTFNFMVEVLDKSTKKGLENVEIYIFGDSKIFKTNFQGVSIIELKQHLTTGGKTYVVFDSTTFKTCPSYKFWVKYNNITSEPVIVNRSNHRKVFYFDYNNFSLEEESKFQYGITTNLKENLLITPKTKWFYCKEDIIKELERTQALSVEKRPIYKINGTIVANDFNWNDVSIYSILNLEYWLPEDGEKLIPQYGELARNGIYNVNVLVKQTIAQKGDNEYKFEKSNKPVSKIEKCTPSIDFPANALYIINGKMADSGYLHKNVKPDEIDKLEVMEIELAKTKFGEKGKSGVILISTKKINKLEEK